ncbi:MAG: septum formation protein Maf [Actinobacteria bacterium]|nr:septum formation protein Maf [Actinomycetota bacterium]
MSGPPLVLASSSLRRRGLLETVGLPFEVVPSHADERIPAGTAAEEAVVLLARRKAAEVAARLPGRVVLAADTLVRAGGEILGKPDGEADARRMLRLLSGRWHDVLTGVVLVAGGETRERTSLTRVRLGDLTGTEVDRYVAGREPYDKAGAYGMQAAAGWFVEEIRGSPTNVIGLPLEAVRSLLAEAGIPPPRLGAP